MQVILECKETKAITMVRLKEGNQLNPRVQMEASTALWPDGPGPSILPSTIVRWRLPIDFPDDSLQFILHRNGNLQVIVPGSSIHSNKKPVNRSALTKHLLRAFDALQGGKG